VPGQPKPIDRAVIDERVDVIDPILLRIWLLLRREGDGAYRRQGDEDEA
jgi:hypothetical protein